MEGNPMNQNMAALETANAQRIACAAYKDRIRKGDVSIEQAIRECDLPITVFQLLMAAPRWGAVRADNAIRRAGLTGRNVKFGAGERKAHIIITDHERGRLLMSIENPDSKRASTASKVGLNAYQIRCIEKRMTAAGCSPELIRQVVVA